ncbi:MAG: hypothetical protein QGG40_20120, partial [Myxococcota bacterium]|nr:hypothetical protein [Myxococcota bacterium]
MGSSGNDGRVRVIGLLFLAAAGGGLAFWWIQQTRTIFPDRDVIWEQAMARFDKNGDGVLTAEEFEPLTLAVDPKALRFMDYDLDEDGVITTVELAEQLTTREPRPLVDNRTVKKAYSGKNFGHSKG